MRHGRREELVKTALDLFERGGFHATGIDRILAKAGVAKIPSLRNLLSTQRKKIWEVQAILHVSIRMRGCWKLLIIKMVLVR